MANNLAINGDRRMTVKEVAEALGVAPVTINQNVAKLFPGLAINGIPTYLNELQVTTIKMAIERSGRNDLMNVHKVLESSTELEMMMLDAKVSEWKTRRIAELTKANDILMLTNSVLEPKAELADRIASADGLKSLSEIGKINGIGPRKIIDLLIDRKILFRRGRSILPFQQHIEAGRFLVREKTIDIGGIDQLYSQTYVTGKGEVWIAAHLFVEREEA